MEWKTIVPNMNAKEDAIIVIGDDAQESVFLELSNYWIAVPKTWYWGKRYVFLIEEDMCLIRNSKEMQLPLGNIS